MTEVGLDSLGLATGAWWGPYADSPPQVPAQAAAGSARQDAGQASTSHCISTALPLQPGPWGAGHGSPLQLVLQPGG